MKLTDENSNPDVDSFYDLPESFSSRYLIPTFQHIGKVDSDVEWSYKHHKHDSYEVIIIEEGSVTYTINNNTFTANKGDLYFIQPGQTHHDSSFTLPVCFYYIRFELCNFNGKKITLLEANNENKQLITNIDPEALTIVKWLYREVANSNLGARELAESSIITLYWMIKRKLNLIHSGQGAKTNRQLKMVLAAEEFIQNNINKTISLEDIAINTTVSSDYISHIFKDFFGYTPMQYLGVLRIEETKRLLGHTNNTLAEIAKKVGLRDPFYLSRKFKLTEGISPTAYRKSASSKR